MLTPLSLSLYLVPLPSPFLIMIPAPLPCSEESQERILLIEESREDNLEES
jgi:hypothetical protein